MTSCEICLLDMDMQKEILKRKLPERKHNSEQNIHSQHHTNSPRDIRKYR